MSTEATIGAHTALVLDDLDAAVVHLPRDASLRVQTPARIPFEVEGPDGSYPLEVRACYSVDGSLELIEAGERAPFARGNGPGRLELVNAAVPPLLEIFETRDERIGDA